jgi:hypothetical protein
LIEKINIEDLKDELSITDSYKFEVDTRGSVMLREDKIVIIDKILSFLFSKGLSAKIDLKNPKRTFVIIENKGNGMKYFGKLIAGREGIFSLNQNLVFTMQNINSQIGSIWDPLRPITF